MDFAKLPKFKYHPNLYHTGIVSYGSKVCNCCGKTVEAYIDTPMYSVEDTDCICFECIADGSAAAKFDGTFIQSADHVDNPEAREELFHRTPGYMSWQGENWKACCNDYCAYMGEVVTNDFLDPNFQKELLDGSIICDAAIGP